MQQPKPMPDLMHRRLPQIIPLRRKRRLGHTPHQDIAPVRGVILRRILRHPALPVAVRDRRRQRAVAEQGRRGAVGVGGGGEVGLEVNVEGLVVAAAEGLLHGG